MTITTTRKSFNELIKNNSVVPVCREIFADFDTPAAIYKKVAEDVPGSFLLESADQAGAWARYSFVGAGSYGVLTEKEGRTVWIPSSGSQLSEEVLVDHPLDELKPLQALEQIYDKWSSPTSSGLPPLTRGFVGFIAWETVQEIYSLAEFEKENFDIPAQYLSFVSELIVIDHREGAVILIANVLNGGNTPLKADDLDSAWAEAQQKLDRLQNKLAAPAPSRLSIIEDSADQKITNVIAESDFLAMVQKSKEHVLADEVSQVVVSQRFDTECKASPLDVYRILRHKNPSPFLYLINAVDKCGKQLGVVGSSPEALITIKNDSVITHPIAGSRPRGNTPVADKQLEVELLADEKEISEHKMLVELSKKDLQQVCEPDTIEVEGYMRVERFSHVMHIVSTVQGRLLPNKNAVGVLKATFPAGTLSGSPKDKALEIISSLEPEPRGVFGGVVGYFDFSGSADLAIAIRTAVINDGRASVQAGAGIVRDSVAQTENLETRNKAAAPLAAIKIANHMKEVK